MNGKIGCFAALCLALALPLAANAADPGKIYFGFDAGQAHYAGLMDSVGAITALVPSAIATDTSDNDTYYRITGGYQFNPYWAVDIGWVDFGAGDIKGTVTGGTLDAKVKAHGTVVAVTGSYPITAYSNWTIFARLGAINAHKEIEITATGTGGTTSSTTAVNSWKTTYGIGAAWEFHPNWKLRFGFDQYLNIGDHGKTGEDNINVASIGIVYQF